MINNYTEALSNYRAVNISKLDIPLDGIPITEVTTYHLSLVVVYYVLAAVGFAFTTVCLIFNFTQRNKK